MPLYQYHAIDREGKKRNGMIEALNEQEAKSMLRDQGVMVTHLKIKGKASRREHLKGDQLQTFTHTHTQNISQ